MALCQRASVKEVIIMVTTKTKYHFEGSKKDTKGNPVYVVSDLKTGELLEWDQKTYDAHKGEIEY